MKFPYLARMGRVAKDGVQLPTEDMNLEVLRRAIAAAAAAAAEAQTEVKQARGSQRAMKKNAESQLHLEEGRWLIQDHD